MLGKYLTKSNLREELNLFWLTVLEGTFRHGRAGMAAGESAAGLIASAIGKLRAVNPGVQIISYSTSCPSQGDGATHIEDESSHLS